MYTCQLSQMQSNYIQTLTPEQVIRFNAYHKYFKAHPEKIEHARPRLTKFIHQQPHAKQHAAMLLNHVREGLYGGAGGGGKSSWLLMEALQYADVPGYNALLLRRTFKQLEKPESILYRAKAWLKPHVRVVRWRGDNWRFEFLESGATLSFGYLSHDRDRDNYDSAEFQFIGFDELTQFPEDHYRFMFTRLRRLKERNVPLRVRGATNPGNVGHLWVKQRFLLSKVPTRFFMPAYMHDNPALDIDAYMASLAELDPITRQQRMYGDWDAEQAGARFRRAWFKQVVQKEPANCTYTRYWDFAATKDDGDYTVGVKIGRDTDGRYFVAHVVRGQWGPLEVKNIVSATAMADGRKCRIRMDQEGGASGKMVIDDYIRMLAGYDVKGVRATGEKTLRWNPFAAQCEAGNVIIVLGGWNTEFLDEICAVPNALHDDQADAASGAFMDLALAKRTFVGVDRLQ